MEETVMNIPEVVLDIANRARTASYNLVQLKPQIKNQALLAVADALIAATSSILEKNKIDTEKAKQRGISDALLDRLTLTPKRIDLMATSLREVAALPDPVGEVYDMKTRPNGLKVGRMRVPFGVIGFIYESRPNVTSDAGALCIKSGNAVILRGGSEAFNSNRIIAQIMDDAFSQNGLPKNCVQLIPTTNREAVYELLKLDKYVNLIIPRGGRSLIEMVMENSRIPVIKHYDGICHVFVDADADLDMAAEIVVNSKCQRTGVCNAMETLLIHKDVAGQFAPKVAEVFRSKGVTVYANKTFKPYMPEAIDATEKNFRTEYLAMKCNCAIVDSIEDAIAHINKYGSHHTDSIVTTNYNASMKFVTEVDSACCHVNCSTRFSDGGEYGMGCEIGISTDKLHARGPMGLTELTTSKFVVLGNGQVRG